MEYANSEYECDLWQGDIVLTHKATGKCGTISMRKGNVSGARMFEQDVKRYGVDKALSTYAKLVTNWQ